MNTLLNKVLEISESESTYRAVVTIAKIGKNSSWDTGRVHENAP